MRIHHMTGTVTNHITFPGSASAVPAQVVRVRRRISPESGLALEKLGHAIEYLSDELVNDDAPGLRESRLEAIDLLMAIDRQVYFNCPEIPSLRDRLSAFLRPRF